MKNNTDLNDDLDLLDEEEDEIKEADPDSYEPHPRWEGPFAENH